MVRGASSSTALRVPTNEANGGLSQLVLHELSLVEAEESSRSKVVAA